MQELKFEQVEDVNGGIGQFLLGYAAGKALDYVLDGSAVEDATEWSQGDHSGSNQYFLDNRDQFNPLI